MTRVSPLFRARLFFCLIFIFGLAGAPSIYAQDVEVVEEFTDEAPNQRTIDSLIMILSYAEEDASKVDVLNRISKEYLTIDYQKSLEYSTLALSLAEKLKYQEGVVEASMAIGEIYINYSLNYYKGFPHLNRALDVAKTLDDQALVMKIFRQFAYLEYLLGAYDRSLEYNQKALAISEELNLYEERAELYANIGDLYLEMGDTMQGVGYYEKVVDVESSHGYEEAGSGVLVSLGRYNYLKGNNPKALYFYRRALKDFLSKNQVRWSSHTYSCLAEVYLAMGEYSLAEENAAEGLAVAEKHNLKKERLENYGVLARIYEAKGDESRALLYYKLFAQLEDSVLTSRMMQQSELFQSNFEKVIDENEKEKLKAEALKSELEAENHALMRDLAIGGSLAALLIAFLLFLRFRYVNRVNRRLREQGDELRELSLVASNTTNSIIIFDDNVRTVWVNDAFTDITGLQLDEIQGLHPFEFPEAPDLSESEKLEINRLFNSRMPFTRESRSRTADGSEGWVSMNVTPVFDDNGDLTKYISVATNITELVKLEEQYEHLVEGSSEAIYEVDMNGQFMFVNDKMAALSGMKKDELLEMIYTDLIRADFVDKVKKFYNDQLRSREDSTYLEFPIVSRGGAEYWLGQNARLVINSDTGNVTAFQMIARDITEKKIAESRVQQTYENQRLLSEIGKQITSSLSVNDIIDKTYENINRLMDANVFGIALYDDEAKELRFPAIIENNEKMGDVAFDINDDKRLGVLCFKEEKEIVIGDYFKDIGNYLPTDEIAAPVAGDLPDSTIYLPLLLKNQKIGVITVQSFEKHAYAEYQVDMIRSIASFASIAIDNANLYEDMEDRVARRTKEVRRQKEELEVNYSNTKILSDIGLLVSSTFDFGEIFQQVHEMVAKMMDSEILGIRLYNESAQTVTYKYEIESGTIEEEFEVPMTDENNFTVWCIKNRKKILINDTENEYSDYVDELKVPVGKSPNSILFYPMIVDQKVIGAITVQSMKKNAYESYHLDILKTLTSYIGTAIDNAALYATLEEKVRERTEEVRQKNKDITASINYARRIQNGMLPSQSFIEQLLPETFVLYKPRDIVSGDFYWMDRQRARVLMAVVDCTGHGVPGAMMSIIGRNLLDQAVNEKGLTMPSQILNFLQVGLMVAFGQTESERTDVFDGMDLSIVSLDLNERILEYAGANNPMYLVRNGALEMVKADKMGISAQYQAQSGYTNVEMELMPGDRIYLFSDGYPDQFGGPRNKKFTYRAFADMLLEIHQKPMSEQHDILEETIESWKGDRSQTDDICVMGTAIP